MSEQSAETGQVRYGKSVWLDRWWLWWHGRHGRLTSWGVALGERPYWTCEHGHKHYPRPISRPGNSRGQSDA